MRILIADDQALVRGALRTLLEARGHEVVAEATSGDEAVVLAERHRPDVVLLDLGARTADGMEATGRISRLLPGTSVVILTAYEDEEVLFQAFQAGARGYLTKELESEEFHELLERAGRGEPAITQGLAGRVLRELLSTPQGSRRRRSPTELTGREREVLELMAYGTTSNRELAEALGVSQNTVRFHVRNILEKLHLHTRAAAVAYALRHGLVDPNVEV